METMRVQVDGREFLADSASGLSELAAFNPRHELSVEAVVHADSAQAETFQPVVSKWRVQETFDSFDAHDAGRTDGLATVGHYGAVFDGRHVYFCPIRRNRDRRSVHGHVLRYDTQGDFHDPESYEAFDAEGTDGLRTVCYYGAAFDGRHVWFVPRDDGDGYHSRVLRYDSLSPFKQRASWQAFDAGLYHSHQGAAFDGRYIYCCPGYAGQRGGPLDEAEFSGAVLRIDTRGGFRDPGSYRVFDTRRVGPEAVNFDGGAFDGRYIYLVPLVTGVAVRFDTRSEFDDPASWQAFDARRIGMKSNVGAVFDGRWLYYCSYGHSTMLRYDTHGPFGEPSSWQSHEAGGTGGLDTGGFDGGFFDGRFVYFVPFTKQATVGWDDRTFHCNFLRYDTRGPFDAPASWQSHDAGQAAGLRTIGYNAGAFDGRFFYLAPLYDGHGEDFHGRILRYDTTGPQASFRLSYCDYGHNGGLCAAVPGPSFIVNTTRGVVGVAAHRVLGPGRHHLAGLYDGKSIKLLIDGELAARREAAGEIQANDAPVTLGGLTNGMAAFRGRIEEVRLASTARSGG